MKKIIFTLGLTLLLFAAQAQENRMSNMRERLASLMEMKDEKALQSSLKKLEKSKEEHDRMLAYSYYSSKGDEEKISSLKQAIVKAFPTGQLAYQLKVEAIRQEEDLSLRDQQYQALLRKNPDAPVGFDMYNMAMAYAAEGNLAKMNQYATLYGDRVTDRDGNKVDKRNIMAGLASNLRHTNAEAAVPLLADGLDYYRMSMARPEEGATDEIRQQRRARAEQGYYSMLSSYVEALLQTGKKAEGLQLIAAVNQELTNRSSTESNTFPSITATYLNALVANEKYEQALPYLEEDYTKSTSRLATEDLLKKAYTVAKGSLDGFEGYKQNLDEVKAAHAQEELMKKALSQEAPEFELKDVDGNTVRLADLRGKVVVLDFWATWCGPCKASFPAMQKAVDKYADDPNVMFLFVHTWDRVNDPTKDAKDYVVSNNYSFEVLMDLRDVETRESAVAKAYGVRGIPTKVIIDPKGQIRFNTSGFSADEEKAVNELSAMIELARKG